VTTSTGTATASAALRAAGHDAWAAAVSHPMVGAIAAGTLPRETFRHYFEQNVRYLEDYARGTDLHIMDGMIKPEACPMTLGHEAAGVVEQAGGVGILVIQAAARAGATVIAVADSPEKAALATAHGAADVIVLPPGNDYATLPGAVRSRTGGRGADVFFELVGTTDTMTAGIRALAPRGRFVSTGYTDQPLNLHPIDFILSESSLVSTVAATRTDLNDAIALAAAGSRQPAEGAQVIDAEGKAVLPGLVDLHYHTALGKGWSDHLPLWEYLETCWYPIIRALDDDDAYWAALASYTESIRCGVTTVNDMYRRLDALAAAAEEAGIRAVLSNDIADDEHDLDTLAINEQAYRSNRGKADGRIEVYIGIEWLPLASEGLLRDTRALAPRTACGCPTPRSR
jgi:Zinc-binding dehydrogenase/Amidohydrolase family/TENA/THI-4/PQQC family/Alcohol dehydrogenase GroES-like domain